MPLLKRSLSSLETWNHLCPSLRRWLPLSSLECLRWNSKHLYLTALLEILYPIWSNVELHMRLMYCKQREKAVFLYVIRFGSLDKRIQIQIMITKEKAKANRSSVEWPFFIGVRGRWKKSRSNSYEIFSSRNSGLFKYYNLLQFLYLSKILIIYIMYCRLGYYYY